MMGQKNHYLMLLKDNYIHPEESRRISIHMNDIHRLMMNGFDIFISDRNSKGLNVMQGDSKTNSMWYITGMQYLY